MAKPTKEQEQSKAIMGTAASAGLAHRATSHLLGYDKVYHGTSSDAAASIRKGGLKKSHSGTGVGKNDADLGRVSHKDVKGKVYTSKNKITADNHRPGFAGFKMGETLTARVPHRGKKRLARDVVFDKMIDGTDKHTNYGPAQRAGARLERRALRIYKHSIPSRFIEGSHDHAGVKQFASKGHMRRYLSTGSGKARFAKGLAMSAASGASALYAAAHAKASAKAKSVA